MCQRNAVRAFRITCGLIDPDEIGDVRKRAWAGFRKSLREAKLAHDRRDRRAAVKCVRDAEALVPEIDEWLQQLAMCALAEAAHSANDRVGLRRVLMQDDRADKLSRMDPDTLLRIGQRKRAIARLEAELQESLDELRVDTLNAHFPAAAIERALCQLVDVGESDRARRWLRRTLGEGGDWVLVHRGAFSSAVFRSLAKAVAKVEGPEPALRLLALAEADASADKPSAWRQSAVLDNVELLAELSGVDAAIAAAGKIRSPRQRRRALAKLYAAKRDWPALHKILNASSDAREAARLIWQAHFAWEPAR